VRIDIPPELDIMDVLHELNARQGKFDIRVIDGSNVIFTVSTSHTQAFLTGITQSTSHSSMNFSTFINHIIPGQMSGSEDWTSCIVTDAPVANLNVSVLHRPISI
jgi:hypothetical protein